MKISTSAQQTIQPTRADTSTFHQRLIQPMGWALSLLCFVVPAILMIVAHYVATPFLAARGMKPFFAEFIPGTIVLASLLFASLVAYQVEGRPLMWSALKDRFRLDRMTGRKWLWVVGGTIAGFILYYLASPLGSWLIEKAWLPLPASIPAWVDPRVTTSFLEKFSLEVGGLHGHWIFFTMAAITFFFNILGEEFWFRGYILPRQELFFGKWTWLIHAVMWSALFHVWKYWDIGLLPAHLVYIYVVVRTKSTTVGILLHMLTNISFPLFVLLGVLGIGM